MKVAQIFRKKRLTKNQFDFKTAEKDSAKQPVLTESNNCNKQTNKNNKTERHFSSGEHTKMIKQKVQECP